MHPEVLVFDGASQDMDDRLNRTVPFAPSRRIMERSPHDLDIIEFPRPISSLKLPLPPGYARGSSQPFYLVYTKVGRSGEARTLPSSV
jgi:hypothetical protein